MHAYIFHATLLVLCYPNMVWPSKGHRQVVWMIHFHSQNNKLLWKNILLIWMWKCTSCTPWRWDFLGLKHVGVIQINHQPDATIFQFIILTFIYSSTCFGCFPTHHQELNDCSGSLWFLSSYRGDSRTVFVVGPTTNTARLSPRYEGKTRGCHCSHWTLDDGRENTQNMLSCK